MSYDTEAFENWQEFMREMNQQFAEEIEENVEAQTELMQTWLDSTTATAEEPGYEDAIGGYKRAYEIWIDGTEDLLDRVSDSTESEDVTVSELRDIWLNATNESFKELMRTTAFASATGESIDSLLDLKRQRDDADEVALHEIGLPTKGDLHEVGERLVELERRQHAVEQQLDRLHQAIDE